ncbi:hypothetical protein PSMK_01880 [Phycisphaera mikurensis NBRC 102666]|uniref:Uncharacterized protein n=1 Tax=Phycisphaera mikurensis (strain NBRC 102666 / KCTC 22515 / FYK2301M01) TaxID=1142394 RepID=I0IAQ9_PHYMF|nr:hypothetical protein PSMK_01880 [Phycisphaera mikurensis NBRC 102666]
MEEEIGGGATFSGDAADFAISGPRRRRSAKALGPRRRQEHSAFKA